MTARERYRAIMHFEPGVRTLKWEFGYWAATLERWYAEGLQRSWQALPPGYAAGSSIFGEGLPFPHILQRSGVARNRDFDAHAACGLEDGAVRIPINWRLAPLYPETILEEDEDSRVLINTDGVKVRAKKDADSLPQFLEWPVVDRKSWEKIKAERLSLDILTRFPPRWEALSRTYRQRDYPLGVGIDGFFSTPRELFGLVRQLTMYYDDPQLMRDIAAHLANLWLAMLEEVLSKVDLDFAYFWEDMSFKNGPLMSPRMFAEFVVPYYRRVTDFLRAHGVDVIFVDTDGDCRLLIPGFLKAGVTGLYPFEVQAGMNIVEIRRQYPRLLIQGGLDKIKVAEGRAAIDAELEAKLPFMLAHGGYIPYCDHLVPPDVPWDNFVYYRRKLRDYIQETGS